MHVFSSFECFDFLYFPAFHLPVVPANTGFSCFRDDFPDDFHDFRLILMILGAFETILLAEYMILGHILMIFKDFHVFESFLMPDMCLYECYGMFQDKL